MNAHIDETTIAGLRWLVVTGERNAAFTLLGQYARESITAVQSKMPEREGLQSFTRSDRGRRILADVVAATTHAYPRYTEELRALATGATVPYEDLLLANLRGDIGIDDGTGCTDLAWRGTQSFVAHNEDGAPALDGHFMLLTLRIDGDLPVTVQWYPGFLPANTLTVNGAGLVWGINHIQVTTPIAAPGRHFVARGLQQCTTLTDAIDYLRSNPSAGGFAYTLGDTRSGRVAVVEAAAGQVAVRELPHDNGFEWHTNHIRFMSNPPDQAAAGTATANLGQREESLARGQVLDSLVPVLEPDVDWFTQVLTGSPVPTGVHRTAAGTDPLTTLCTTVTNLTDRTILIRNHHGTTATLTLTELTAEPH
ncbi:C45 family autoproteolytic acyltransferase/hydolase [Rhodococcus opacus]|uniref:C45 family autoproteolytic acyltransferase/hydolase n=1 Tax=Rhodococcus opacus TaxID=37919 RepID=UPI000AA4DBE8|nr:C45 family peptidase [Rhodococcus opacus]